MTTVAEPFRRITEAARSATAHYAPGGDRPLRSYVVTMSTYSTGVAALVAVGRARGHRLPERISWSDIALITVATHKLARLITKESVTSPLRAPFTRYEGLSGPAELHEEVEGEGTRKAIGELLTCPFCFAVWTATGFTAGIVMAPQATRVAATMLTAVAGSDTLQLLYAKAQD